MPSARINYCTSVHHTAPTNCKKTHEEPTIPCSRSRHHRRPSVWRDAALKYLYVCCTTPRQSISVPHPIHDTNYAKENCHHSLPLLVFPYFEIFLHKPRFPVSDSSASPYKYGILNLRVPAASFVPAVRCSPYYFWAPGPSPHLRAFDCPAARFQVPRFAVDGEGLSNTGQCCYVRALHSTGTTYPPRPFRYAVCGLVPFYLSLPLDLRSLRGRALITLAKSFSLVHDLGHAHCTGLVRSRDCSLAVQGYDVQVVLSCQADPLEYVGWGKNIDGSRSESWHRHWSSR